MSIQKVYNEAVRLLESESKGVTFSYNDAYITAVGADSVSATVSLGGYARCDKGKDYYMGGSDATYSNIGSISPISESNLIAMENLMPRSIIVSNNPAMIEKAEQLMGISTTYPSTTMAIEIGNIVSPRTERRAYEIGPENNGWIFEPGEQYRVLTRNELQLVKALPGYGNVGRILRLYKDGHALQNDFVLISPTTTRFMDIVKVIRNTFTWVFGSKEEKLLRKSGLKDDNGNFTEEARQMFIESLMQDDAECGKSSVLLDMAETIISARKEEKEESCC